MTPESTNDRAMMSRALELAQRGQGRVEPNPMVGCVITRAGSIIGEGYHQAYGMAHAEAAALAACRAAERAPKGATVYVTLEPCNHTGKTPPCSEALIKAGVSRVVMAMTDPHAIVAGRGIDRLRKAGITVEVGLMEAQARRLNEAYIKRVTTGLPWVILKWAATLDGKTATQSGDSRWISNADSRRRVHELRGRVDAVMVGVGTAVADDPQLTARDVEVLRTARRGGIDPHMRSWPSLSMYANPDPPVIIATNTTVAAGANPSDHTNASAAAKQRGIDVVQLPAITPGELNLRPLLAHLAKHHDATNVLVEGGCGLAGTLLEQGLVDQLMVFVAPKLLGDPRGLSAVAGMPRETIADAIPLELISLERIGDDALLDYRMGPRTDLGGELSRT